MIDPTTAVERIVALAADVTRNFLEQVACSVTITPQFSIEQGGHRHPPIATEIHQ